MRKTTLGFALIIIGMMMVIYTGVNFITTKKVVDLGSIKINSEENHPVQWSPWVGAALVLVGFGLVVQGKKIRE